ncbi:MAG: DUF1499 domain-containing protein [Pseudomonadota bacterium]
MGWRRRLIGLGTTSTIISIVMLLLAGPGHRFGIIPVKIALLGSALAIIIALLALLLLLIALFLPRRETPVAQHLVVLVIAGAIAAQMFSWLRHADPQIHDITTDTSNPPEFILLASARADAPNPIDYPGEDVASQQRQAYPDLQPVYVQATPAAVLDAAAQIAETFGWAVSRDASLPQIEATDTTGWYGFKDDIIVRAVADDQGTRIDVRSKSRVGKSDLGTNAKRIRGFLVQLEAAL